MAKSSTAFRCLISTVKNTPPVSLRLFGMAAMVFVFYSGLDFQTLVSSGRIFHPSLFLLYYETVFGEPLADAGHWSHLNLLLEALSLLPLPMLGIAGVFIVLGSPSFMRPAFACGAFAMTLFHLRNPLLGNSSDMLLGQMFVCGFFLSAHSANGVFLLQRHPLYVALFATYGAIVYIFSVFFKLQDAHWLGLSANSALWHILNTTDLLSSLGTYGIATAQELLTLKAQQNLSLALTFLILCIEFFCPIVVCASHYIATFHGSCSKQSRRTIVTFRICYFSAVILLLFLHTCIAAFMSIGPFPFICLALWAFFLFHTPWAQNDFLKKETCVSKRNSQNLVAFSLYIFCCAASGFLYLLAPNTALNGSTNTLLTFLHLKQQWSMFSPPPLVSTSYQLRATNENLKEENITIAPENMSYGARILVDNFWAGTSQQEVNNSLTYSVALELCHNQRFLGLPQNLPALLKVELWAVQKAHQGQAVTQTKIAAASCPWAKEPLPLHNFDN